MYQVNIGDKIDYAQRKKTMVTEDESITERIWVSFKEQADKDGEDVLIEMIEHNTIEYRKNPQLPADSKIPDPGNLQMRALKESTSKRKKTRDETSMHEHDDPIPDNNENFLQEFAMSKVNMKMASDV